MTNIENLLVEQGVDLSATPMSGEAAVRYKRIRCGAPNTTKSRDKYKPTTCRRPVVQEGQRCHSHSVREFFEDEEGS